MTDDRETLYDLANVYVTHRAAAQYADFAGLELEVARRELTRILLDAVAVADDPGRWRRRNKSDGVDAQARVDIEGDLAIVVDVRLRPYGSRRTR